MRERETERDREIIDDHRRDHKHQNPLENQPLEKKFGFDLVVP